MPERSVHSILRIRGDAFQSPDESFFRRGMRLTWRLSVLPACLLLSGCGGSASPAQSAPPAHVRQAEKPAPPAAVPDEDLSQPAAGPKFRDVHRETISALQKMGANVVPDVNGDVLAVKFSGSHISDDQLKTLAAMESLRLLNLDGTNITDDGLVHVAKLTKLKVLHLCRTRITDSGLEHLECLKDLAQLRVSDTRISNAGIEHLKKLTNLRSLHVSGTNLTSSSLEQLKQVLPALSIRRHW
jgi:hypothetical protein